jgi:dipeptidase E
VGSCVSEGFVARIDGLHVGTVIRGTPGQRCARSCGASLYLRKDALSNHVVWKAKRNGPSQWGFGETGSRLGCPDARRKGPGPICGAGVARRFTRGIAGNVTARRLACAAGGQSGPDGLTGPREVTERTAYCSNGMHDIVAIGGNSFPKGTLTPIQRYVLSLSRRPVPRICFIPTAVGDAQYAIDNFHAAFGSIPSELSHLTLFNNTTRDVEALLVLQDVIIVSGGNTRNMLLLWEAWGVAAAIRAAWDCGTVLAGQSAGGLCWFESGITDSYPHQFREMACLGWVPGSFCPHYDSEPGRQPVLEKLIGNGTLPSGYAVEDDAAIHMQDGKLFAVLSQTANKTAYAVRAENGTMIRDRLDARSVS